MGFVVLFALGIIGCLFMFNFWLGLAAVLSVCLIIAAAISES